MMVWWFTGNAWEARAEWSIKKRCFHVQINHKTPSSKCWFLHWLLHNQKRKFYDTNSRLEKKTTFVTTTVNSLFPRPLLNHTCTQYLHRLQYIKVTYNVKLGMRLDKNIFYKQKQVSSHLLILSQDAWLYQQLLEVPCWLGADDISPLQRGSAGSLQLWRHAALICRTEDSLLWRHAKKK